ncbi:hypothetical protein [Brasilonema octagenarum]|nr:hypothetical protein [Brasilonema octagenarum]
MVSRQPDVWHSVVVRAVILDWFGRINPGAYTLCGINGQLVGE